MESEASKRSQSREGSMGDMMSSENVGLLNVKVNDGGNDHDSTKELEGKPRESLPQLDVLKTTDSKDVEKDRQERIPLENNRVRSIKNEAQRPTKRISSGRGGSASNTPRKGSPPERGYGQLPNGTPKKSDQKLHNGKSGLASSKRDLKSSSIRDSSNLSRENSTDSDSNSKVKQRPLSSKSLGRATMASKISNPEEKKLKRHTSKHRITKTVPQTSQVTVKDRATSIKNSLDKLKSSKVVDRELSSASTDSENRNSVEETTTLNVAESDKNGENANGNTKDTGLPNGKANWSKLSGAIQKEKSTSKANGKSSKKDLDRESKGDIFREGTKSSIVTSPYSGDQGVNSNTVHHQHEEKGNSVVTNNDSWIQSAIPYLPLGLSVVCLIMNIILPGSGTVLSGLSILCCGKPRLQTKDDQLMVALCVNVWVGVSQLFTVTFLLVGWFWSLSWGIKMVALSVEYKRQKKKQRELDLQALALSAFGSQVNVRPVFSKV